MTTSFKPPSKSLTPRDWFIIALIVIAFLGFAAALLFLNLTNLDRFGGGGDFYLTYVGARAFHADHYEPYSGFVPNRVQDLIYGRAARAGEKPYILDIPFHILLLYFPFSLLSNPLLARAIFTLILELALLALAIYSLRLTDWEQPRLFPFLFVAFCALNFYSVQALRGGASALLLGLFYAAILLALRAEQDELIGALLALSCYQWEIGAPFLFLTVLRVLYEKRARVWFGFAMTFLPLLFVSLLIYPDWAIPFMRAVVNNLREGFGFSTRSVFTAWSPFFGVLLARTLSVLLIALLVFEWSVARGADFRRFYWASCLSLAIAPLLGYRSEMENLSVLVIPLAFIFSVAYERWRKFGHALNYFLLAVVFFAPYLIQNYLLPQMGVKAEGILFFIYPAFTVLGLYWIRWWALRPPRTWYDRARNP